MAMLGAFLGWVYKASPEEQQEVQHLYTIEHAMVAAGQVVQPSLPSGVELRSVPCRAENCQRCMTLRGGYQFRWYDARWVAEYNRMKREGGGRVLAAALSGTSHVHLSVSVRHL